MHAVVNPAEAKPGRSVAAAMAPMRRQQGDDSAFAPERLGNKVQPFTTGEDYFKDVCKAIQTATKCVFICGWQVNWSARLDGDTRLIDALKKAVGNGAKVYVMPWQSPKVPLDTGDFGTMLAVFQLNAGRSGLSAFCCPSGLQNDYEAMEETFFSHHQKLVVIDNRIAYVGGIDLAFGRRDDEHFSLAHGWRQGPEVYNTGVPPATDLGPNALAAYVSDTDLLKTSLSGGLLNATMQQATAVQNTVSASAVGRLQDQIVLWWRTPIDIRNWPAFLREPLEWSGEQVDEATAQARLRIGAAREQAAQKLIREMDQGLISEATLTRSIDMVRDVIRTTYAALLVTGWATRRPNDELMKSGTQSPPIGDALYRADQPRMPWQDVHARIEGPSVYDLASNFIRRWNSVQQSYLRDNLLPASVANRTTIQGALMPEPPAAGKGNGGDGGVSVRVLRSAPLQLQRDEYRANRKLPVPVARQQEIHDAMVAAIRGATHFIYIENQFFQSEFGEPSVNPDDVSAQSGPMRYLLAPDTARISAAVTRASADNARNGPKNKIARAVAERIERAIRQDQPFHVYMVLPVHPEGSLADLAIVGQIHWTMQSLAFGSQSLINRIRISIRARQICAEREGAHPLNEGDWEAAKRAAQTPARDQDGLSSLNYLVKVAPEAYRQYLTLLNLRTCELLEGQPRTEQVYVHSKLLIVDDNVVILGSANINDRSLNGGRDSELAVLMSDTATLKAPIFGGPAVPVRKLAHELRVGLWKKHFALSGGGNTLVKPATSLAAMVDKPAAPATIAAIQQAAASNLEAYKAAFNWVPNGRRSIWPVWSGNKYEAPDPDPKKAVLLLEKIKSEVGPYAERMPFHEAFWKKPPAVARPAGIQGYICALPIEWTMGENNHPGMNMILLTQNDGASDAGQAVATNERSSTGYRGA